MDELARRPVGLLLITGPAGSGTTTTLNNLVDLINSERRCKIVTIEDPIEFVPRSRRAIVVQQEVLTDPPSFSRTLIHVLRQDPDVIATGELRDHEAMATSAVRHLIRENQLHLLDTLLQTGAKDGMVLFDNCRYKLYRRCLISYDVALSRARQPERLSKWAGTR